MYQVLWRARNRKRISKCLFHLCGPHYLCTHLWANSRNLVTRRRFIGHFPPHYHHYWGGEWYPHSQSWLSDAQIRIYYPPCLLCCIRNHGLSACWRLRHDPWLQSQLFSDVCGVRVRHNGDKQGIESSWNCSLRLHRCFAPVGGPFIHCVASPGSRRQSELVVEGYPHHIVGVWTCYNWRHYSA